jgi:chloramphenicol O-acetyltransferase type A
MRYIDMDSWPRRQHFSFFGNMDHPFFGMCANVDLTAFYPYVKQRGISFTAAIVYVVSRAANAIPEFRYRLREGKVVEHEIVHPSLTVLYGDDLFSFCFIEYTEDFAAFGPRAVERIAYVQAHPTLEDDDTEGVDDLLFMTAIPWVSFTSFDHPMHLNPADSVPRFAWGKFFGDSRLLQMPLSVHGHHGVMDGIHVGRYFAEVQDYLNRPDSILGGA